MTSAQPSYESLTSGEVYVPGLSVEYVSEKYGIPIEKISKLGSAENPHGPSPKAVSAMIAAAEKADIYPDWTAKKLREAIAERYGLHPDAIVCGSGETEVISMLIRAYARPDEGVLMHDPCFPIYRIYANCEGRKPIFVRMGTNFDLRIDDFIQAMKTNRPKIVFLTNPHNPSGRAVSKEDVIRVCKEADPTAVVALDEAYVHYTEDPFGLSLLKDFPNLIVLRTMSKAFGLAGLRVGFAASADPMLVRPLLLIKPTWNIGQVQIAGGVSGIWDEEHVTKAVQTVVEMRRYVEKEFESISGFSIVKGSKANFFLTQIERPDLDSTFVFNELLKRGVIVKNGTDIAGLGDRYLRVDVNQKVHMDRFLSAMEDIGKTTQA
jgi:histidinol-phosphate aminotransferase